MAIWPILLLPLCVASNIPCGKSFLPCPNDAAKPEATFIRESRHSLAASIDQWASMHHVDKKAVDRSKAAYASIAITKRLTLLGLRERELRFGILPNQVSSSIGNCPIPTLEVCPPTYYRSYSGLCNNVAEPEWGTSHTPLSRMLKPAYADEIPPRHSTATIPPIPFASSEAKTEWPTETSQ
ncbi:unnamed protein product [Nippostrongylus brasiliensis]|uniref:SCP domain-containing protein n=1 Tax=Nippostrongylus brasiliensis TaxID=27835 RepID=A0A0N4YW70_NIPBR|nr:unnamed protein product [Nippostrongylus brasiliensis]